ncbi:MAG: helix-turn-helix domain-containing protein [Deltaproteobacteria bacterium]|nr:helix-turn-helix domain-containing protein [Deltaproteobacteria bacterium]
MTTRAVARLINRSPAAIRNLVMRRRIPFRKPGGRLLFIRSEIERWINDAPGVRLDDLLDGRG